MLPLRAIAIATFFCGYLLAAATPKSPPNIVVILADDLGYGDLQCYRAESKVPTPNLDRLAKGGMRFTQAYCPVSVCSPTRYALMTGCYPWRSWHKKGVLANWERPMIEDGQLTLPGLAQQAGYVTAGFGKWHLGARYKTLDGKPAAGLGQFKSDGTGSNIDLAAGVTSGPADRGFGRWFGFLTASEMLIFDGSKPSMLLSHDLYEPPAVPGASDLPTVTVADYLPLLTEKSIEWLRSRQLAADSRPFFLYYAPYVPHIPLAVGQDFRGRTKAGEYGDYVHQLDHEIGRLLAALDGAGYAEHTLVLFASDNGSQFRTSGNNHRPNGILRGTKQQIYEGGVRTPLIARLPSRIPAGAVNNDIVALNDILATVAALLGTELPAGIGRDSLSILPLLEGQTSGVPIRNEIIVQSGPGQFALRQGSWKLIPGKQQDSGELYDLSADPGEKQNRYSDNPELARSLHQRLKQLLDD